MGPEFLRLLSLNWERLASLAVVEYGTWDSLKRKLAHSRGGALFVRSCERGPQSIFEIVEVCQLSDFYDLPILIEYNLLGGKPVLPVHPDVVFQ